LRKAQSTRTTQQRCAGFTIGLILKLTKVDHWFPEPIKEIMDFEKDRCAKRQSQTLAPGRSHSRAALNFFYRLPFFPCPDDIFFACIPPII
jgi:hypothetical protein